VLLLSLAANAVSAQALDSGTVEREWRPIGLLRIRDLTPFGIQRLDFLPADALFLARHRWALEANLSYQNTFVLSETVADYLRAKGNGRRVAVTPEDVRHFFEQDQDAYIIDGELGLFDLTARYQFSERWSGYVTIPVLGFADGVLDEFIESFHDRFAFDTGDRELVKQDDLTVMSRLGDQRVAVFEPPDDGPGDPVFAGAFSLFAQPRKWNLIGEAAIKVAFRDDFFHSSGKNDYGVQLSFQRFFRRQALYLSLSEVYFSGFDRSTIDPPPVVRHWITTAVAGYEFRIHGPVSGIVQLYGSPSTVQGTTLDAIANEKYQISGGMQWRRGRWFYRIGVTENLSNFDNTPDLGATFSMTRAVLTEALARSGSPPP
jgi:hypothetical protein